MRSKYSGMRAGVYVDVENIIRHGGSGMRFEVLRDYACRDGAEAIRLNAYLAFDQERARYDNGYREHATRFHCALREIGFKLVEKPVRWFKNEDGKPVGKANSDVDLAVDMLLQSENLDRVVLVSGDGDFTQVVRALQNKGCRVELLAFQNVSHELRRECDFFVSGYLIPGLLPQGKEPPWGELGSRVRGICHHYQHERGFGFLRYLVELDDLTVTDSRETGSPYRVAFFHRSEAQGHLDRGLSLPSRDTIFEFTLVQGSEDNTLAAHGVTLVTCYAPGGPPPANGGNNPGMTGGLARLPPSPR
jgi:uncharacterized LabA/DUF88 family protein